MTLTCQTVNPQRTDPPDDSSFAAPPLAEFSFAHSVEQGWESECEVSDLARISSTDLEKDAFGQFQQGSNHLQQGFLELQDDLNPCASPLGGFDDDACNFDDSISQGYSASTSGRTDLDLEAGNSVVADISACVDAAFSMLPIIPPKPIWEQGVWADIFGDGKFLNSSWTACALKRPQLYHLQTSKTESEIDLAPKPKARKLLEVTCTHADIVVHKTDQTWQEERESILQNALKRWLMVCTYFNAKTLIRVHLDCALEEMAKLTVLADVFRGRAPSTLLKRVRAIEKMCQHLGIGAFPPTEAAVYEFFTLERNLGAPPSRLRSYMEALNFCRHILNMDELANVVNSRRCLGTTSSDVPHIVAQAEPLKVEELNLLHKVLQSGEPWDRVFAGALLFATYSRSRWADLMHTDKVLVDRDEDGDIAFIEGHTSMHKTMRSSLFRHRFLPLTAPGLGVTHDPWAELWLDSRKQLGIEMPPTHVVMPAPNSDGAPSARPLTSQEASQWMRKLISGSKEVNGDRKISIHSCKATCLSYCAKYGMDAIARLQLGYHTGGDSGLKMVHTYSRDALAEPLAKLNRVLTDIRLLRFKPDCTRSGRFNMTAAASVRSPAGPMSGGDREAELGVVKQAPIVDLVSEKEESEDTSGPEVSSSSGETSQEEFPEVQKSMRVFLPPSPPPGYVFWQHSKLKTLHLAMPENKRVFMCNRYVGRFHTNANMSIRYDTPVCRMCVSATKDG